MTEPKDHGAGVRKTLYEEVAEKVNRMIEQGVFRAGERIPSVRSVSRRFGVSVSTVLGAYSLLEDRGVITARPQSGYYVNARTPAPSPAPYACQPVPGPTSVTNSELSLSILQASSMQGVVPLGAAIPNPDLLPLDRLSGMLSSVARRYKLQCASYDVPPGCRGLRVQIARRGLAMGCGFAPEEIVTTSGCLEAVFLALRATCKAGDIVAIESPTYYNFLLMIEQLDLRALEIPCHPRDGVSMDALRYAFEHNNIRACLFNPNFNNPTGSLMPEANKKALMELLEAYDVPLIEDDIHGDLAFAPERPPAVKAFDKRGLALFCTSFSKTLAPGYRVGWIAPGRYQAEVEQIKSITSISTATPTQLAVAEFLANGGYDRHLRKIRRVFAYQTARMAEAVGRCFPEGVRVSQPVGGCVLWVELPKGCDAMRLYEDSLANGISIAPGPIFSATGKYANCIRLNAAFWSAQVEQAIEKLGSLAKAAMSS
jgi:DNA-binding transcriptional MocR family regulator